MSLTSAVRAETEQRPPEPASPLFKGRAIYAGVGAGVLADLVVPTENWRIIVTLPVARWAMVELFPYGYHFAGPSHHGSESVTALGIGAGLRVAPWPDLLVRPYLAARFAHVHFWPDPWGEHNGTGGDSYSHSSHHRWGGALALGFDAPLGRRSRFRAGFDLETTLLSGPGTNVGIGGLATIGYAL